MENEMICEINRLNIDEHLKEKLLYFNEKLEGVSKKSQKANLDIIIDRMSKENIEVLLENIVSIIEKHGLYNDFINYRIGTDVEDIRNSVIIVDDFLLFKESVLDVWNYKTKIDEFFTNARLNNNMIIFTHTGSLKDNIEKINSSMFDFNLCIHLAGKNDTKDLYGKLLKKYKDKNIEYKLSYNFFKKIVDILEKDNYVNQFNLDDYIYDYSIKKMILENSSSVTSKTFKDIVKNEEKENTQKRKKEDDFKNFVGLDNIKKELESMCNYLEFNKKMKNIDDMYLNLFFLGNPGTGKTTVARMYASKLYEMGFINENKLIEIVPNDLVGAYVGQTRETTRKILNKAKNGVLFIDEAYLIYSNNYSRGMNPYMEEALVELIKYLENPKNVVIFAGYPSEMKKLYEANPGIRSRIYKEILFEDYTTDELYKILIQDLEQKGLKIDLKSKNKIIDYINDLKSENNFGNARTIKQLSQKMIMNFANRKTDNKFIEHVDLPKEEGNKKMKMGFGVYG